MSFYMEELQLTSSSLLPGRAFTTTFDYCNWILIVAVILWTVVFLFFEIFLCGTRPSLTWSDPHSSRHLCINPFALQTSSAVFNWVMDLAIVIEPLFVVRLRLRRRCAV